jgi:hypothetical protein
VSEEFIIYNGMRVAKDWPEKVAAAQLEPTVPLRGLERPRIRYGDEPEDWGADRQPCHDCAVVKGQFHVAGCDVERCPLCGGQLIGCECDDEET